MYIIRVWHNKMRGLNDLFPESYIMKLNEQRKETPDTSKDDVISPFFFGVVGFVAFWTLVAQIAYTI